MKLSSKKSIWHVFRVFKMAAPINRKWKLGQPKIAKMPFVLFSKAALRIHFSLMCIVDKIVGQIYRFPSWLYKIEMIFWLQEVENVTFTHSFGLYSTVFVLFCFLQETTWMQCFKHSWHYKVLCTSRLL